MIHTRTEGRTRILVIDRPDKANALTGALLNDLADAVEQANGDEAINAIILTGAGRVFSAGADLDSVKDGLAKDPAWERLSSAVAMSPVLTVAAMNGTAAGGSLGMVLACDIRVAVPSTKMFYPVVKVGVLPQPSDPARLTALIGPSRARLMLMCGARMEADEALSAGLIDRIADDALVAALDLAKPACEADREFVHLLKLAMV